MAKSSVILSLISTCLFFYTVNCGECVRKTACSCEFEDNSIINLKGLFPTATKEKFLSDTRDNFTYYFSGCENQNFTAKDYGLNSTLVTTGSLIRCIRNISIVDINVTDSTTGEKQFTIIKVPLIEDTCTALGTAEQIDYSKSNDNSYKIIYQNNKSLLPSIRLVCDSYDQTDLKIHNGTTDALTLYSSIVCLNHIHSDGLSSGSVFLIILFVGIGLYLIGGGLIMYTMRGARGFEVIPHLDFWKSIPGLVGDGIIFMFSGCRVAAVPSADTYDRI